MDYTHNLSLTDYPRDSVPDLIGDRANEYYQQYRQIKIAYSLYGGKEPPVIDCWMFRAYLHSINSSALYTEIVENAANELDMLECLEFVIQVQCPAIIYEIEDGKVFLNFDPEKEHHLWASVSEDADTCVPVQMSDSISSIATELRGLIAFSRMDILDVFPDPFDEKWLSASYDSGMLTDSEFNSMLEVKYPGLE